MADNDKLELAEAHVASLQSALDKVQDILHVVDAVQQDARRIAKALRIAGIALAIGGTAFSIAAGIKRIRRGDVGADVGTDG